MHEVVKVNNDRLNFFCLGCKEIHSVNLNPAIKPVWTWNNDFFKPTLSPFVLVSRIGDLTEEERHLVDEILVKYDLQTVCDGPFGFRCESHVYEGTIKYFYHSTHELKGKSVEMVPI